MHYGLAKRISYITKIIFVYLISETNFALFFFFRKHHCGTSSYKSDKEELGSTTKLLGSSSSLY